MQTIAKDIQDPLAPNVLAAAGVPIEDASWFNTMPSTRDRIVALRTPRGEAILSKVRSLMVSSGLATGMHMQAA